MHFYVLLVRFIPEETQKLIKDDVELMKKTTIKLICRKDDTPVLALKNKDSDTPSDAKDDLEEAGSGEA
jgi:hypothetical protein